jgi:PAS domain S-box-containing protein
MKTKVKTKTEYKGRKKSSGLTDKFFKTILDSINDTISIINVRDFRITAVNSVFLKEFKLKEEEVIGKTCYEVTHHRTEPCTPPDNTCPLLETLKTGKHSKTEHIHYDKNGEKTYVEVSTSPIYDGNGKIIQVVHVARNITERKKAEEALSRELRVNSAIAELSSALISTMSIDDLSYIVQEKAKSLTDSTLGYVGYIDPHTGYLICPTLTKDIWETCQVTAKGTVFEKFAGLWGWVLENRKPLLTNTPADDPRSSGIPQGHIPIKRFLSAPALIGEMLVGQVAVANAERDYTERDLEMIERLAALYAVAVQRKWAEEELKTHRDNLEYMVRERTAKLTTANKRLKLEITERKQAEKELKESEDKFKSLAEESLVGVYLIQDGLCKYVNPRLAEIFGYTVKELIDKKGPKDVVLPEDWPIVEKNLRKRISGKVKSIHYEFRGVRKDGEVIHVEVYGSRTTYNGKPAIIGTLLDITERKKMEELLLRSKQDWEDTFNTITDMVTIHDKDFNIIRANKAAEKILGLPFLEVKKAKCYKYYHGTNCPPENCPSCQCLKTGKPTTFEMFEPHLNMFIEIRAIPRFNNNNELVGLIHVVRDITERKKIEDELNKRVEDLERFYDLAVDRELKMKELKEEIRRLKAELSRYKDNC